MTMSDVVLSLSNMWQYLEHLSTLLENIGIALRAVPDSERQWVREGMSVRARATSSVKRTSSQRAARTTSRSIEYVTSSGGELKPGRPVSPPPVL